MITIIMCTRKDGNPNHYFERCVHSLEQNTSDPNNIELLVKHDYDDYFIPIKSDKFPIRYFQGHRGKGYTDIHLGYQQLLYQLSPKANIIGAIADDFVAVPGWDKALNDARRGELSIVHGRLLPGNAKYPVFDINEMENVHIIDEAPFWTRKLLMLTGLNFVLSFTDAWTLMLEYFLWKIHGISITGFTPNQMFNRYTSDIDQPQHRRWHTERKDNFDFTRNPVVIELIKQQADNIAGYMLGE